MTKFFGERKKTFKRPCEYIRNKYSKSFGNGRAPIEGPAKVRSERTTALPMNPKWDVFHYKLHGKKWVKKYQHG